MTIRKAIAIFVIALQLAASACAGRQLALTSVVIQYPTLLALARESAEFKFETAWCLTGKIQNDSVVVVSGVAAPTVTVSTENHVEFWGCEGDRIVGWYHNHPPADHDNCMASDIDIYTTNINDQFQVALIGCNRDSFIYFFQGQLVQYKIMPSSYRLLNDSL